MRPKMAPDRSLAACAALILAGCRDPEDGRPRGGGTAATGNYVRGHVHPPSKIDATKDLSLLRHDGPRPAGVPRTGERPRPRAHRRPGEARKSADAKGDGPR